MTVLGRSLGALQNRLNIYGNKHVPSEAGESIFVKLDTSCTIILPPTVSVLCTNVL